MKFFRVIIVLALLAQVTFAGNKQRIGQAGASEIMINPFAASSGLSGANVASVRGVEAIYQNIAGAAFVSKTELAFNHSQYMVGSGLSINNFALLQRLGESGALSISFQSFGMGENYKTTNETPEGNGTTFDINYSIISLGYSKAFSNSIYGGFNMKIISEGLADLSSTGVMIDAGIIYKSGIGRNKLGKKNRNNFRLGITLKNVGPTMIAHGDGVSFRGFSKDGKNMTIVHRTQDFEMPTQLIMGLSYDIRLDAKVDTASNKIISNHMLTLNGAFVSNSFSSDQFLFGAEYSFKNLFQLRAGYLYQSDITSKEETSIALSGPSCGATVNIPLNKEKGSSVAIDYSFRATRNFDGIHSLGVRVVL